MEKGAGSSKKWEIEQEAREIYQGARGKIKKEQGAKIDEKGAMEIGKKE